MDDDGGLRAFEHDGEVARAVLAVPRLVSLPPGPAHEMSVVAGLGRSMAGEAGSDRRRTTAVETVAAVLRRVARAGRVHSRLRVEREPGAEADEVSLSWQQRDASAARALAEEASGVLALLDAGADEGAFLRACREAGERLRGGA